jgi:uncharacterized protein YndB with AHSA1/START domain
MSEPIRGGDIPGVQLRRRQPLRLSVEEAWRWLTEPPRLALWLAEEAVAAPVADGYLELRSATEGSRRERGETLEISPPRRWVLAFRRLDAGWTAATRLALEVAPRPSGCELDVLQSGFQDLRLSVCLTVWEEYRRRWRGALARLEAVSRLTSAP